MAVEPTPDEANADILSSIRANAQNGGTGGGNGQGDGTGTEAGSAPPSRTITLYRSGFTINNGPLRRLDDPSNSEFLRDLAKGVVPRELQHDDNDNDNDNDGSTEGAAGGAGAGGNPGDRTVGLVDKRHMEYGEDGGTEAPAGRENESFMGEGQSLGSSTPASAMGGIIAPPTPTDMTTTSSTTGTADANANANANASTSTDTAPIVVDESKPTTVIQVRLLNGRKLRIKINTNAPIRDLVHMVNASGDAGVVEYVLSAGFPPKILEDLGRTVLECGLNGSQVVQKKA